MNICFLTHNLRQDNGAGVFSRRLIAELTRSLSAEAIALTTVGGGELYEKPILHANRWRQLGVLRQVRRIIRQCDVVHAMDGFPYGFIAVLASIGLRKKIIITAIGSGSIQPLHQWPQAFFVRWMYRRAAAITAISAFTRDEILKKMPELKITVINPGVDAEEFATPDARHPTDERTKKYKPYILGVGQLRWRKGYHLSIRAFSKIAPRFPDMHYVIVGKHYTNVYDRRLKNLIAELGLQERVHILQDVETREYLIAWYKNAELFCLFSQNILHDVEGFGQVFLEAAAAGLPVVGSKGCGVDDAVEDGQNGILVPTRDPDDFADAIEKILSDTDLKRRMSERSLAFARASQWQARIARYVDIYRSMGYKRA